MSDSPNRLRMVLAIAVELVTGMGARGRYFLIPLVIILLLTGTLLVMVEMMPILAPFVYTLF